MQEQYAASTSMEADVQGMPEFVSDKISNEMTQYHAVDTLLKVDVQGTAMQGNYGSCWTKAEDWSFQAWSKC